MLHLGHFILQTRNGGSGCRILRLQFRWIEDRDQVSGLHRRSFVHQQFLNTAFYLRADDDLVRVDCSDEDQITRMIGREKVVGRGDDKNDSEKNEELVARDSSACSLPGVALGVKQRRRNEIKYRRPALRNSVWGQGIEADNLLHHRSAAEVEDDHRHH